jgi:hypothetical protein
VIGEAGKFAGEDGTLLPSVAAETIVIDYADPPVMPMSAQRPWSRVCQGRC